MSVQVRFVGGPLDGTTEERDTLMPFASYTHPRQLCDPDGIRCGRHIYTGRWPDTYAYDRHEPADGCTADPE